MDFQDFDALIPEPFGFALRGKRYCLRVMDEERAIKFRAQSMRSASYKDGQAQVSDKSADLAPYLVSLCLYEVTDAGEVPVTFEAIKLLPAPVASELFKRSLRMNGLSDAEDLAKNSPSVTTGSSA